MRKRLQFKYRFIFLFIASTLIVQFVSAQTSVTIKDGLTTNQSIPIEPFYGFTYSQQIYLQSEISLSGEISEIEFEYNGNSAWTDDVVVYMGHTSKTTFSGTTDWIAVGSMSQVFSGSYTVGTSAGWYKIILDTPFDYNNVDNLVIAVDENTSGYHSGSDEFYCASATDRAIYYRHDSTNPDPASPPTATGIRDYVPSLKITIQTCTEPTIGTATVDDSNCNMGTFDVSLEVTAAGEGASVDVTDGMGNSQTVTTFPTTVTFTGYTGGTSVTINADNGSCNIDANTVTENCACTTPPSGMAVIDDTSCGSGQFHVDVTVSSIGDAASVSISDGTTTDNNSGAGYGNGAVVQMGPYSAGTSVTITIAGITWTSCSIDLASVTEDCVCMSNPIASVNATGLDCAVPDFDIDVTVTDFGSGTAADIYIDAILVQANALLSNLYTFTGYSIGNHTVTVKATGGAFSTCETDYMVSESCNGGDTCADAVDILGISSSCDLTVATNENVSGLVPCFESMGNGNTMGRGNCSGAGCAEHSAYWYTEYKDLWYVIDIPDGSNEFSVHFTGLTCAVAVFPYTSSCGSLSLMSITGGVGTGLADSDNDGNIETAANDNPLINTDGVIHFKGAEVATASTSPIYLRVFAHDDKATGTACNSNDIVNCSFDIMATSPLGNDACANAINVTINNGGSVQNVNIDQASEEDNDEWDCSGTLGTGGDVWYSIEYPDVPGSIDVFYTEVTIDGPTGKTVRALLYDVTNACGGTDVFANVDDCQDLTFSSPVTTTFNDIETTDNNQRELQIIGTSSNIGDITVSAKVIAANNSCDFFAGVTTAFDISSNKEMNFDYSTDSQASFPTIVGNDLWFQFDPIQTTGANGLITASTTAEIIIYGAAGVEYTLALYKGNTVSSNNCANLMDDYLETITVAPNGSSTTVELACLDELHLATDGGYLLRVVQTAGPTSTDGLIRAEVQPAGPYNNDCGNIWDGSGPAILGGSPVDNPFIIEPGFSNYVSGDFENATDCHPDIASAVCNGIDQQAIAPNEDRDLWYVITLPDNTCGTTGLESSSVITSAKFLYNAGSASEDGVIYIYDGCDDTNLIDCSGALDGAPSGAGDAQFDDPESTWTVSGLTQGESYLVRVKPHDISSSGVMNEFDFDLSWKTADPAPCNDDPSNAESLGVGCFSYSSLETWSAQGATHTSPVDGAPENDVWFSFTAPTGNGGTYTSGTAESWVSVFFEEVSGHTLYMDLYNTTSTDAAGKTWDTSSSDQAWGVFGNLNEGQTYYIRLYHKELATVNVQYKIAINDGPGDEPGWACGENSSSNLSACASGCKDLRETFFKIDLPDGTPGNMYWMIEVTGMDQDLDFELRSKYLNGNSTYVTGTTGTDGAVEGSAADFDHPCSSAALESAVTISSTTTGLTGCDGNDSLGDIDPASSSQGSDGDSNVGSGVSRVYFNMNGAVSGQKDYYYLRVFIDPTDPRFDEWAEVKICDISFKGPYSTQALAEAGGTPDGGDCMCGISNVAISDDNACNGDDATFTVTYDVNGGSGNYEVYATADNTDLGITSGDVLATVTGVLDGTGKTIDVTIAGPTTGTTISVDVRDTDMNSCNGASPKSVDIATCPNTTVATNDFNHTPEGTAVTGNVLTNDYDPQGNPQSVNTTLVSGPTNGNVTIDASGNYTYTPIGTTTGEDNFSYQVCDDQSPQVCAEATVYIEVIPDPILGNEPPLANPDNVTTEMGVPVTASMTSNDNDPDGDALLVNTTPVSGPTNGSVTINSDGTYTYTPDGGFTGVDMFEYKVCDDPTEAACDTTTVTIEVVADAGNITSAVDDSGVGLPNEDIIGDLVANDFDAEGDQISINLSPTSNPTFGNVVINADGTYTYTPNMDYVGNDEFKYQICDDGNPQACDEATVHISILPELPNTTSAVNDFNHTPMGTAVDGNVLNNDYDVEGQNQSIVNTTPITPPSKGNVTLNSDGSYTYTPNAGESGEDFFVYEVCDDHATDQVCTTATVYIEIIPDPNSNNNPPLANTDYSLTKKNTPIMGNMEGNDNDPDGDPLMVNTTPETNPTNGSVTILADGSYTYTPNVGFVGSDMFEYEICDDGSPALCDITTVFIDVVDNQENITSASDDSGVGIKNQNILGNLLDNDQDPEGDNQTINTTPTTSPANGNVTIFSNGLFEYMPIADFVGNDEFTYEVCDDGSPSKCTEATVYITVLPEVTEPELTISFDSDGGSYAIGQIRDGIFTLDNIGSGTTSGQIIFTITLPNSAVFTTIVNETMTSADVAGGTTVNNSDWIFQTVGSTLIVKSKTTTSLTSLASSKIGLTFTAVGSSLSTAKAASQIITGTAGDIIETNNYAQGTFIIN